MRVSYLLRASHYTPKIQFLGPKWKEAKKPHAPHPHPMAPTEIADNFQSFLAKVQSSSTSPDSPSSTPKTQSVEDSKQGKVDRTTEKGSSSSGSATATSSGDAKEDVWKGKPAPPVDYENFWEAPEYIWKQKEWTEREIEAVMSGGATEIRSGP